MIEILQFGLGTNRGGIETYLKKIWDNIDHNSFHFNFIDMTGEGKIPCFYEELVESGCSFYKVTPRNASIRKNREDLEKIFREHQFDILHYNINTLSYLVPVEIAISSGTKVLVHSRNAGASYKIITKILHYINKRRLAGMDVRRIAVSTKAGQWLFGKSEFEVFYNGIDINRFTFSKKMRSEYRNKMKCEDKIIIGNVGAFLPAKNHRFMVDVFSIVNKKCDNAVLWFVGDGKSRNSIEKLVKKRKIDDKVVFWGMRNDLEALYSAMDVFWLPSLYEGFPNAVLEAQCEGLPCLISNCIPQDVKILESVKSLSLKGKKEDWAEALISMSKYNLGKRMRAGEQLDKLGFSTVKETAKIMNLYREMMNS